MGVLTGGNARAADLQVDLFLASLVLLRQFQLTEQVGGADLDQAQPMAG